MTPTETPLYISDFITGVLAALALKNLAPVSLRGNRLDQAFGRLYEDLKREANEEGFSLRFRIVPHQLHGNSETLHQALYDAAKRDLISLDNPEFQDLRLKIQPDEAMYYFNTITGKPEMYKKLADMFLKHYREVGLER